MSNPFHKRMPLRTDLKIRWRLWREALKAHQRVAFGLGALFLAPALATFLFFFMGTTPTSVVPTEAELVAEIRAAQAAELAASESAIYHVRRVIREGSDKPTFVALQAGDAADPFVQSRTDEIQTWQHSDTALALVRSNGTERSFESYLSREHDGKLGLHHFGPPDQAVPKERGVYDAAHDLASLYTGYTSLERPDIPVLPEAATYERLDQDANAAYFESVVNDDITIAYVVDLDSQLVREEIIYVTTPEERYEMTRVTYLERDIIPAEEFETIFDPAQYDYTQIL